MPVLFLSFSLSLCVSEFSFCPFAIAVIFLAVCRGTRHVFVAAAAALFSALVVVVVIIMG